LRGASVATQKEVEEHGRHSALNTFIIAGKFLVLGAAVLLTASAYRSRLAAPLVGYSENHLRRHL